jgi:hypothetical protein
MATQERVAADVDAAGVVAGGALGATRPRGPKVRRPRLPSPSQGSLKRTNQHRATALRPTVRARDDGVGDAADAVRRPAQLPTTPRTRYSEYASHGQPIPKWSASMGRPGWRPSDSDGAKVVKQAGGARRC